MNISGMLIHRAHGTGAFLVLDILAGAVCVLAVGLGCRKHFTGTLGLVAIYSVKINSVSHVDVNQFPNNLHMQIFQLLVPNIATLVLSVTYYIQHHVLRNAVLHAVREELFVNSWYPVMH